MYYNLPKYATQLHQLISFKNMSFNRGSAFKYLYRAGNKENSPYLEDLRKARAFIDFELNAKKREAGEKEEKIESRKQTYERVQGMLGIYDTHQYGLGDATIYLDLKTGEFWACVEINSDYLEDDECLYELLGPTENFLDLRLTVEDLFTDAMNIAEERGYQHKATYSYVDR